jgi:hypothetical protein
MFNKEYFVKRFNDLSSTLQREENGYPVEKEFYVTGGDIENQPTLLLIPNTGN